jgi:hypothetical protein
MWLKKEYPRLKKENVRLRIRPGFASFKDFEIAWNRKSKYLYLQHGGRERLPKRVAKDVFENHELPDGVAVPDSVAEEWGSYVHVSEGESVELSYRVSEGEPVVLRHKLVLDIIRAEKLGNYYSPETRTKRPCSEFFEDEAIYPHVKKMFKLWKAFLEEGILSTKNLEELTGIIGQGRASRLYHVLTVHFSICERVGDEFRLTDEAVPFVQSVLANAEEAD